MSSSLSSSSSSSAGAPSPAPPLSAALEGALRDAARAIALSRRAGALLICSGAGMGVDSGLGTFRGVNRGVWPPLRAMNLDFSQLSEPSWFETDPGLAWSFWSFRFRAYTRSEPHAGYGLLSKWGGDCPRGVFSLTSNIDGHWSRTPGIGPELTCEVHGALTHNQCVSAADDGRIWEADRATMDNLDVPEWLPSPGEAFEARSRKEAPGAPPAWHPVTVAPDLSLLDAEGRPFAAIAVRAVGGDGRDLFRARPTAAAPFPTAPGTGAPARPNVMMFGDGGVVYSRMEAAETEFRAWKESLPADTPVTIVEVGAGTAIYTIRLMAREFASAFPNSTLVRINLEAPEVEGVPKGIPIPLGALDALTRIDAIIDEIEKGEAAGGAGAGGGEA